MAIKRNLQNLKHKTDNSQQSIVTEKAAQADQWQTLLDTEGKAPRFLFPTFTELKNLIAFLLLNLIALSLLGLHPGPSAAMSAALGMAPPLLWINLACSIYLVTELILIFCRERERNTDRFALYQLFFFITLYFFYWYAGALQEHFTLLLSIGGILQLLECFARKNRKALAVADG